MGYIVLYGGEISYWGPSAVGGGQSYGLVFTAPVTAVLLDYTLSVMYDDTSFPFVSQVYAWNGTTTTGSALYTSGVSSTPPTLTPFTFDPDVPVIAGDSYIAFVTNEPDGVSLGGSGLGGMASGSGPATFMFAEGNPSGGIWSGYGLNAAFHADFGSAVPEPSTWTMMLLGFAGFGFAGYRTSRKADSIA